MRRVIGIDIHRTFGEVVIWEDGKLDRSGRVDMTRTALEGFGKGLRSTDEVVIEATGNCMAVSRVLSPFVARVIIANPLQVKAIAQARVKTDKIDAGTLASLRAAGYLPEIWVPDAGTERRRRLTARRFQIVRHRTRIKNEVHAILHAYLIPRCPHADLFSGVGRAWLLRQPLPEDESASTHAYASRVWGLPIMGGSARWGVATHGPCWSKRLGRRPRRQVPFTPSLSGSGQGVAIRSPPSRLPAS